MAKFEIKLRGDAEIQTVEGHQLLTGETTVTVYDEANTIVFTAPLGSIEYARRARGAER